MANEITLSALLRFAKNGQRDGIRIDESSFNMAGSRYLHGGQSIGTVEEVLQLGEVVAGGLLLLVNRDPTNFVSFRAVAAAVPLAKLGPGEPCLLRLHPSATAPTLQANVAACQVEYLLLEA